MNRIEPFDPARHDRTGFSCGVEAVDNYFKKTAGKLVSAGNVRLFVMVSSDGNLIGFYAINAPGATVAAVVALGPPPLVRGQPMSGWQRP